MQTHIESHTNAHAVSHTHVKNAESSAGGGETVQRGVGNKPARMSNCDAWTRGRGKIQMKQYLLEPVWWEQGGTPAEACTVYPELFSDCFLPERSVCMRQPERETACVYVCEGEGGETTPPPVDWASLTGWRGRWGHRNKANTHTHIFSRWLLCPRFSFSFPPPRCHPSTTCWKTSIPHRLAPSFCLVSAPPQPPRFHSACKARECPSTFHLTPLPARAPIPSSLTVR